MCFGLINARIIIVFFTLNQHSKRALKLISKLFLLISGIILYLASVILTPLFQKYAVSRGFIDIPGPRSSHAIATPRGAGIVFAGLWVLTLLIGWIAGIYSHFEFFALVPGLLIVAALGYRDDQESLSPRWRLWGQVLAGCLFLLGLGEINSFHLFSQTAIPLGGLAGILALLTIIWFTNLFNFMDGIDGLAATEAIFVLGVGGLIFWFSGVDTLALLAWTMAVLVAGFLVWNWPKAEIFMGDVGSYTLGFLIAAFAIIGDAWYDVPIVLWFILYALFLFDTTITLIRRIIYKKPWMEAHRDHAYQRLLQAGFRPLSILLIIIGLNTLLAILALLGYFYPNFIPLCLVAAIVIITIWYLWVEKILPHKR